MNIYKARRLLGIFQAPPDSLFYTRLGEPWVDDGGNVYASDGYSMICIKDSGLEGIWRRTDLHPSRPPDGYNCDVEITAQAMDAVLVKDTKRRELCDECGGDGLVMWTHTSESGKEYAREDECPVCEGSGYGRKVDVYVKFQGGYMRLDTFKKIRAAMTELGIDAIRCVAIGNNAALFQVAENIEVLAFYSSEYMGFADEVVEFNI